MKTLQKLLQQKETYLGVAVAIAFQLIFFSVWLTAYDGVSERTDQLQVALVTDDTVHGPELKEQIHQMLPFEVIDVDNVKTAQQQLSEDKAFSMVIHIPAEFSTAIEQHETASITYYINQALPAMSKQVMESAAVQLNQGINAQVYELVQEQLATQLPEKLAADSPESAQTATIASAVLKEVQEYSQVEQVKPVMEKVHPVEGFRAGMIPLMVVLASFIGAMIMSQHLQFAADRLQAVCGPWALFASRQLINLIVALTISILTLITMQLFQIDIAINHWQAWLFQSALFFSFLTLSQLFVLLFGNPGMLVNIALTAIQLATSGALVPREVLSEFYQQLGAVLPAAYGVNGYFSMIYGGGSILSDLKVISLIAIICLSLGVLCVFAVNFIKRKSAKTANVQVN